jgi:hypothetical protein
VLLDELGCKHSGNLYHHQDRMVIFRGDFIDRGPYHKRTLELVRPIIDAGAAKAVIVNHEYNAIAYFTSNDKGGFLQQRNERNNGQHKAFIDSYSANKSACSEMIEWFKSLPLWLDLEGLRVVHACWDSVYIKKYLMSTTVKHYSTMIC